MTKPHPTLWVAVILGSLCLALVVALVVRG